MPPGTTDSQWKELRRERDDQVKELTSLSGNSKFMLDLSSGHAIHHDNPVGVANAIAEVIKAVLKNETLKP